MKYLNCHDVIEMSLTLAFNTVLQTGSV